MQRGNWKRRAALASGLLVPMLAPPLAQAATRSMTGAVGVINPSTASPYLVESGPAVFGRKIGAYAPTDGFKTVTVTGATGSTSVGRQVTIPQSLLNFSGSRTRPFPAFGNVAQTSQTLMSVQDQATFVVGGGALAECPGPGCTSSGAGTAISWCPPLVQTVGNPAPGSAGSPVGNWDCASYPAAGSGNRGVWMAISNSAGPGANHFGGTFSLLRNVTANIWRVLVQPGTQGTPAEVSRSFRNLTSKPWTGGRTNFGYTQDEDQKGPRILASLGPEGRVTQTFGCVNGTGTVGQPFSPGNPYGGPGSNCGTPTVPDPPGQGWGFKMTTGTISGSDFYPFLDATTALGTPLAPNFQTGAYGDGFFFTRMGTDTVSGSSRNLVLLGGGISVDPTSGNSFFRITDLRLNLQVPEPAVGLGLVAGAGALVALARRRR